MKCSAMLLARQDYTKERLFSLAKEHVGEFCALNNLKFPKIKINNAVTNYGYYRYNDNDGYIVMNYWKCKMPVFNPTNGRLQSFPGNKTDRTIAGVLCHEVGHYIDFTTRNTINLSLQFRSLYGVENTITSYDLMDIERVAESLRLFILNPMLLKAGRPKTFDILSQHLKPLHNWPWKLLFSHVKNKQQYFDWCEKWIQKCSHIDKEQMYLKEVYSKNSRVRYINLNEIK